MIENTPGRNNLIGNQAGNNRVEEKTHPNLHHDTTPQHGKTKFSDPFRWGVYSAVRKYLLNEL